MAVRAILSDIGNVVAFFDNDVTVRAFEWYTFASPEEIRQTVFARPDGLSWRYARGELTTKRFRQLVAKELGFRPAMSPDTFDAAFSKVFRPNPDVISLWGFLRKRRDMIVTAVSDIEPLRHEELEAMGIMGLFDHAVLSYQEKLCKPSQEMLVRALDLSGVRAEEAVFVDDVPANLRPSFGMDLSCHAYRGFRGLCAFLKAMGVRLPF